MPPTSQPRRSVRLIDGRLADRPFISATLTRDCPASYLESLEARWREARERAVSATASEGNALEHAHWDWRNKVGGVESGLFNLVAVECEGEPQGIMAVARAPAPARLCDGRVVYIDYLEAAPWNLRGFADPPRFLGVGTALVVEAIRLSAGAGLGGRVGLHSLPQAEAFYTRCRLTRLGPDPGYYDLTYFEYTEQQAAEWLASIGEVL